VGGLSGLAIDHHRDNLASVSVDHPAIVQRTIETDLDPVRAVCMRVAALSPDGHSNRGSGLVQLG
jgi:hypothetical protein